jgi:hypothetical protein
MQLLDGQPDDSFAHMSEHSPTDGRPGGEGAGATRWEFLTRHLVVPLRHLYRQHQRLAWEALGFAVALGLAVALLSAFGAALLREPHPGLVGCRFGSWALVLGLGIGFLLIARSHLQRALRLS